jgi:hypothetical protein
MIVPFLEQIFQGLVVVAVVVVAVILSGLAYDCAYAGTGCSADDGALEAAAEDCAEDRAAASAYQGSLAGADAALIAAIVVMGVVVAIIVVVVVASAATVSHAVVIGVVAMVLGWEDAGRKQERNEEDRFSKLGHLGLDADFGKRGTLLVPRRKNMPRILLSGKELAVLSGLTGFFWLRNLRFCGGSGSVLAS